MSDQRFGPSPVEAARKAVESGQRAAAEIFGEVGPVGEVGPMGPGPCPRGAAGPVGCSGDCGPTGYEVELSGNPDPRVQWLLEQLRDTRCRINQASPAEAGDPCEDAICMREGHTHVNREAEAICSLRWQLAEARWKNESLNEDLRLAVDDAIRKTGEIILLKEEQEKAQATFRALSGPILPELLVGIAEGRVHLALQAQITMSPRPEPKDDPERVARAAKALEEMDKSTEPWSDYEETARRLLAVADAAPKANTCAPSTEGLRRKEDAALRDDTIRSVFAWITVNARIDPVDAYAQYIRDLAGREAASGLLDKEVEDHG